MHQARQIQAVAGKLSGLDPRLDPARLDPPWRTVYERLDPVDVTALGAEQALWHALRGLPHARAVMHAILDALPDRRYPSLLDMDGDLPPVEWLWPGWLPQGMLSLLGAAPGAGKSLLALDLARRIIKTDSLAEGALSEGGVFPDGAPVPCPGASVIYVDAEAIPQVLNQRARAWAIDRSRLYLMLPPEPYDLLDLNSRPLQDRLVDMCHALRPALVVVDSLSSITLKRENQIEDIRPLLAFLASLAREYDTALLLVHHLRKRGSFRQPEPLSLPGLVTADDFRGSSHIIAVARSVLALGIVQDGPQPDRNGPRRLEVIKTNLCAYPPPLGLRFDARGAGGALPRLVYTEAPQPYREPTLAETCADWLLDLLAEAGEPLRPADLLPLAREAGFSRNTLYRARAHLDDRIADTHPKHHPDNRWTPAEQ